MASPELRVEVASNADELRRAFRQIAKDQVPFATALALTRLAQRGQEAGRDRLSSEFKLRSRWVRNGLRIKRAEKRDWPNPVAIVGHRDEYMVLHETGGMKRARGGGRVLIPTRLVRRTSAGRIRKRQRPAVLGPKLQEQPGKFGARRLELMTRRARRDRRKILYLMRRRVRIRPRFRLTATVNGVAADHSGPIFEKALEAAIRSARVRTGRFTSSEGKTFFNRAAARAGV